MNDSQFKVLVERIDQIQKVVDHIENDLDKIYKDNQELAIRVGSLEQQMIQTRDTLHNIPHDLRYQIREATQPMIDQAQDLKDTIASKKVLALDLNKIKNSSWWKFW